MNIKSLIAALTLSLISTPVLAEKSLLTITGLGTVEYEQLFILEGEVGQTQDQFAQMVAPKLRAYSDQTHFEACGVIAKRQTPQGDQYGIVVGTNYSHVACVNVFDYIPNGYQTTKISIHSHGTDQAAKPTRSDMVLAGNQLTKRGIGRDTGRPLVRIGGQGLNDFSLADFESGAGYLAQGNGGVIYHDGNSRRIHVIK